MFLTGPNGGWTRDCLLDSGADDTIFPANGALALGIDLAGAPTGGATQAGGAAVQYAYAPVTVHISDGNESCEWLTLVGFTKSPLRRPLLGQSGFLQFFDAPLFGSRREILLIPNAGFSGRYTIH